MLPLAHRSQHPRLKSARCTARLTPTSVTCFFFLARDPRNTHAGQAALPMLHRTRNAISTFPLVSVARRDAEKQPRDWSEMLWREITRSPCDATPSPLPGWMSHARAVSDTQQKKRKRRNPGAEHFGCLAALCPAKPLSEFRPQRPRPAVLWVSFLSLLLRRYETRLFPRRSNRCLSARYIAATLLLLSLKMFTLLPPGVQTLGSV